MTTTSGLFLGVERGILRSFPPRGSCALDHPPHVRVEDGPAAQREHPAAHAEAVQPPGHRGPLEPAEGGLPVLDEDVADRLARGLRHEGVGVSERHAKPGGEQQSHGRLARGRRPDQHHDSGLVPLAHEITSDFTYPSALRRISSTESPPNFSRTASASTSAVMASATTPAAGTAVTSLRWLMALAGSPVRTSTVASARGTVEMGFMAARARTGSPVVIPPSMPPARLVTRRTPSAVPSISSWACEPRRPAVASPSPISTPLMAWMLISAPARRPSSRRSQCTWLPSPGGSP